MSKKWLIGLCVLACGAWLAADSGKVEFPVYVHAGRITGMQRTSDPQEFVDLSKALAEDDSVPVQSPTDNPVSRTAPEGMVFVVIDVEVQKGRTLSRVDYVLAPDKGGTSACLGLALGTVRQFDERQHVVKGPAKVEMLFQCPEGAYTADLLPAPGFLLARISGFELQKRPEPVAPAPAPAAAPSDEKAAPAAEAAAAKAAESKPAAAPAAEAKAEAPAEEAKADAPAEEAKADAPAEEAKAEEAKPAAPAAKPAAKPAEEDWF
ncbi:MAG: hypothetical protein IJJ33_06330 [Victivallales bacterium]|nr:hypothetical protein [Victivallales bacterium]